MKMRACIIVSLLVAIVPSFSFAQVVKPFPQGIGFEIGGGHNSATWHYGAASPERGADNETSRSQFWFWFTPTARVSYTVHPIESAEMVPFIEFNIFGGKGNERWVGEIAYLFESVGVGVLGKISVFGLSVGPGIKVNRHLKVLVKVSRPEALYCGPSEADVTDSYRRSSIDAGVRIGWNFSYWSLAGESWFGLTQLQSEVRDPNVEIYQRHFRILLGYQL